MPPKTKVKSVKRTKKVAAAPYVAKQTPKKETNPLIEKRPKNFGIGGNVQPKRNLSRYVRWPKYIRLQRQRQVLYQRLKVPPSINQFTQTLDRQTAIQLFKLLHKYRPETKAMKKERLRSTAEKKSEGAESTPGKKPITLKYGINNITRLIEQKKATLVVISHDVDPIEIVVFLPALCRKMDIPYCIVKGKARLGKLVHKKTATAVCLAGVRNEDKGTFGQLADAIRTNYNERFDEIRKTWGGGIMGIKARNAKAKVEKLKARELAKKM
ncbi:large ribosomal subunit protein eL8-like [Halichondria panicea]|uniref:large ribosomal subunit protein eL8-like n=1 Tax=Halichondria panicea TaxID=6063 RepID=UPI00312B46C4